jgi:quercetin dioxygenase-like cupin family protein
MGAARATGMAAESSPAPLVVRETKPLWFLGTLARVLLDGGATGGVFAVFEVVLPRGASPPVHSHPQDETFYVLDGTLTAFLGDEQHRCSTGSLMFAPRHLPHSCYVHSDTARVLVISTPSGIEDYVRALSEPATWPWLQPPSDGPRVPPERIEAVGHEHDVVNHGPPPAASS